MTTEQEGAPSASAGGAPAPDAVGTIRRVGERSFVLCDSPNGDRLWVQVAGGGHIVDGEFWRVDTRLVVGAVPGTPAARDPRDAEIERLRAQVDELAGIRVALFAEVRQALAERDEARVEMARLARCYDAVTARADSTEAERDDYAGRLRDTDAAYAKVTAERDRLRQELDLIGEQPPVKVVVERDVMATALVTIQTVLTDVDRRLSAKPATPAEPRRFYAHSPEPEVGTVVGLPDRKPGGPTWTRHPAGGWQRSNSPGYRMAWKSLFGDCGELVEVVSTDGD